MPVMGLSTPVSMNLTASINAVGTLCPTSVNGEEFLGQ